MNDNIKWAQAEIEKHRKAIADLEAYVRVAFSRVEAEKPANADTISISANSSNKMNWSEVFNPGAEFSRGYKKRTILATLLRNPSGLRTPQIVESLIAAGLKDSNVSNTSPQLSAYGSGDTPLVTHNGGLWTLTQWGREWLASAKN